MSTTDENGRKSYNKNFISFSEDDIKSRISHLINTFQENELGGNFGKSKRFNALFLKVNDMIFEVIKNIQLEFMQSVITSYSIHYTKLYEKTYNLNLCKASMFLTILS